jgi:hypothetical protein
VSANPNALEIGGADSILYSISLWVANIVAGSIGEDVAYQTNLNDLKGIVELPYFENPTLSTKHRIHELLGYGSRFYYYYSSIPNQDIITGMYDDFARGTEAYRFIFDNNLIIIPGRTEQALRMQVPAASEVMIGNPFVSNLDFESFYRLNSAAVEPFYRLYKDNIWEDYVPGVGGGSANKYIAPLQAFFIQTKGTYGGNANLYFAPDSISVTAPANKLKMSGGTADYYPNALYVNASNNDGESWATICLDWSNTQKDVLRLFNFDPLYENMPQVFTANKGLKHSVRYVVPIEGTEIQLGISSASRGNQTLRFENLEHLDMESLTLVDKDLGIEQNLFEKNTYTFNNIKETMANRFVIKLGKSTDIDQDVVATKQTSIYTSAATLFVEAGQEIASVELANAQGQLLMKEENIGNRYYQEQLNVVPGVYVVRVMLVNGEMVIGKVIVK